MATVERAEQIDGLQTERPRLRDTPQGSPQAAALDTEQDTSHGAGVAPRGIRFRS